MEVKLNKVEDHMAHLTINIETVDMEEYVEKVYQRFIKGMQISICEGDTDKIAVLEKNKTAAEYAEIKIIDFFPSLRKL